MLLKSVALWLPSCKPGDKEEGPREAEGASTSAPSPAGMEEEVRKLQNACPGTAVH